MFDLLGGSDQTVDHLAKEGFGTTRCSPFGQFTENWCVSRSEGAEDIQGTSKPSELSDCRACGLTHNYQRRSPREGASGNTSAAIADIDTTLNTISSLRGKLGAAQNRLNSTINNLGIQAENISAANSRIRDIDVALETSDLTRNSILQQASLSILAQANAQPGTRHDAGVPERTTGSEVLRRQRYGNRDSVGVPRVVRHFAPTPLVQLSGLDQITRIPFSRAGHSI